ncbi:MAG: PilW family protein [Gammaproteobacteria bacterium]|nr:PilW family protein [Gammaproteobacteria bacterium]
MIFRQTNNIKQQSGVSLIELLIAMVIGMLLTAGAIQLFISNKATYKIENALSRLQETGRFVVETMSKEIRMAGYNGCSSRGNITPNVIANDPPPFSFDNQNSVLGFEATGTNAWTPTLSATMPTVSDGTDVITIQRADECGASVTGNFLPTNANVQVNAPNSCGFQQGQVVMITDCVNADIYGITNTVNNTGPTATLAHSIGQYNSTNNLAQTYGPDSQIYIMRSTSFYIAPDPSSGEPALWMASWLPNGDSSHTTADYSLLELAEGVEDMQILFGIDNAAPDEYADTYVTADAVTDWTTVRSVRINLLLRSEDRVTEEPRTITFNGATAGGGDNRLRMIYTATVSVRNRLP